MFKGQMAKERISEGRTSEEQTSKDQTALSLLAIVTHSSSLSTHSHLFMTEAGWRPGNA